MTDRDRNFDDSLDRGLDRAADKTSRAANKALGPHDEPTTTSDVVGETAGGLAGAATGAAIGSLGGPIGTVIGALAGAVGGWWSGRAISEAASTFTEDDDTYYRNQFESRRAGGALRPDSADVGTVGDANLDYDTYRPAYQLGQIASRNPDYRDRDFADIEPDLRRGWTDDVSRQYGRWDDVREHARSGFDRGREARLTLSEEQLAVGRRAVPAGEATIRKTVETERVRENVPVQREEISVERRPLNADAANVGDVQIGEDEIRIPLTREEVVTEKRAVPVEEVIVRKDVVTENQVVEADLQRERLDASSLGNVADRDAGTVRGGSGNLADRVADKVDDMKDRVDGNPASRPGRDFTDREAR